MHTTNKQQQANVNVIVVKLLAYLRPHKLLMSVVVVVRVDGSSAVQPRLVMMVVACGEHLVPHILS